MNIRFRNVPYVVLGVRRFQEGGSMEAPEQEGAPEEGGAPEQGGPQGGGDPMEMLMQLGDGANQALQKQDGQMALSVCDGLVQFISMVAGGGLQQQPQGEPVYRRGGKIIGYLRRK